MKIDTRILLAGPLGPDLTALEKLLRTNLPPGAALETGEVLWKADQTPQPGEIRLFVDLDEKLHLLRWLETQEKPGAPGAIELLLTYSSVEAPRWTETIKPQAQGADLVLDGERSPADNQARILFYLEKKGISNRSPDSSPPILNRPVENATDFETLYSHYHGASPRFGRFLRALNLQARSWTNDLATKVFLLVKRGLDFLVASLFLFFLWPVYGLVAFLIYSSDPGPVFFFQTRIGQWGRPFRFPKFRTMVINAEALKDKLLSQNEMQHGVIFKIKRDPRIIPIGFILRRYSLDELPQIWTVLTGRLSLVGPRPPVPREVALYTMADRRRLETVPGLTCIWQVSGRSDIPFPEQVRLDTKYIDNRSLALDIKLLVATFKAVLGAKGAY